MPLEKSGSMDQLWSKHQMSSPQTELLMWSTRYLCLQNSFWLSKKSPSGRKGDFSLELKKLLKEFHLTISFLKKSSIIPQKNTRDIFRFFEDINRSIPGHNGECRSIWITYNTWTSLYKSSYHFCRRMSCFRVNKMMMITPLSLITSTTSKKCISQ